jgi:transposase-like protein
MTANRKYDDDFRANAIAKFKQYKAEGKHITELAKELGVGDALLHAWAAKDAGKPVRKAKSKSKAKADFRNEPRTQYPLALKHQAVAMVRSGMKVAEVARQLNLHPTSVNYWRKNPIQRGVAEAPEDDGKAQAILPAPKATNGIGGGGAITDALIYLRHAEKEILEMIRDGKIQRPDPAHLLTLLALASVQKAITK